MKEKLAIALVGTLVTVAFVLFVGGAKTDEFEIICKLVGVVVLAGAGLLYKFFEKKGLFDKTYADWRKECLTNKD